MGAARAVRDAVDPTAPSRRARMSAPPTASARTSTACVIRRMRATTGKPPMQRAPHTIHSTPSHSHHSPLPIPLSLHSSELACSPHCVAPNGYCLHGKCYCAPGYGGDDCAELACPGGCNQKGECESGKCYCEAGYGGDDCGHHVCPDKCGGNGHCQPDGTCACYDGFTGIDCSIATCAPGCVAPHGECRNGTCHCAPGYARALSHSTFPPSSLTHTLSLPPSHAGTAASTARRRSAHRAAPATDRASTRHAYATRAG